eukprot:SAG31_NODE_64_length_28590_cov_17.914464_15_plen_133_part_00
MKTDSDRSTTAEKQRRFELALADLTQAAKLAQRAAQADSGETAETKAAKKMLGQLVKEKKRLKQAVESAARWRREAEEEKAKEILAEDLRSGGKPMDCGPNGMEHVPHGSSQSPYAPGVARSASIESQRSAD